MEAGQAEPVVRVAVADAHVVVLIDVDRLEQCLVAQPAVRVVGVLVEVGGVGQQFQRVVEVRPCVGVVAVVRGDPVLDGLQRRGDSGIRIDACQQRIDSVEDVAALLPGKDLVISAIDEPPFVAQRIVNKAIVEAGIPCVFAASQVSRGRVFTVIPGQTGCFDCLNVHYSQRDPQFVSQFAAFSELGFDPPSIAYGPSILHPHGDDRG